MFLESQERRKFVKAAIREGEAPAEPTSWTTMIGRSGSAGASPSLPGIANDILQTGMPHSLTDDAVTMESVHGFFGSSHLLVMISCVFNTKHGDVQLAVPIRESLCFVRSLTDARFLPAECFQSCRNEAASGNSCS